MCPAQKWPVPDTLSCPSGTDEPSRLSVAAPRSKSRPATESEPSSKVSRTRPSVRAKLRQRPRAQSKRAGRRSAASQLRPSQPKLRASISTRPAMRELPKNAKQKPPANPPAHAKQVPATPHTPQPLEERKAKAASKRTRQASSSYATHAPAFRRTQSKSRQQTHSPRKP